MIEDHSKTYEFGQPRKFLDKWQKEEPTPEQVINRCLFLGGPNRDVLERIEKMNKPKLVQDWPPKHVYEDAVVQGE